MEKISALIITFNEERNIRACIQSLKQVCDDIVVVDSCSVDKTLEIAQNEGAQVITQAFLGDGPQRIKGLPFCKHDWVLNLDADERLEDDTVKTLSALNLSDSDVDVYEFKRNNFIGDRTTHYAGQYPDYVARLFNKKRASFTPVRAHTRVKGKHHRKLNCHIKHYSYKDYFDLFSRQCKYASWMAQEYAKNGKKVSVFAPLTHSFWTFFRHYFLKLGFLAGLDGLSISMAKAMGVYLKYAYAVELQQNNRSHYAS